MHDEPTKTLSRRRLLIAGGLGTIALTAIGWGWFAGRNRNGLEGQEGARPVSPDARASLVAFMGALVGRELSSTDVADLSDRLDFRLGFDATFKDECAVLARYLDTFARQQGAAAFKSADEPQKERVVQRIMTIDHKSLRSRILRRLSSSRADYYRMRWSTVWQLSWIYSQSGAAWRTRGYTRWPGIPGNWREILVPGAPYP